MNLTETIDYSTFKGQYFIIGEIILEGPLRIGRSRNEVVEYSISAAAPVLLDYNSQDGSYYPFIPGSSLKGVFRATFERIAKTFGFFVCQIIDDRKEKKTCGKCLGCRLFGSETSQSNVIVRSAYPVEEAEKYSMVSERPHYNSEHKRFYPEEIINPSKFVFQIDFLTKPTKEELALILLTFNEFNLKRAFIGGGVSRGNGAVRINTEVYKRELKYEENKVIGYEIFKIGTDLKKMHSYLVEKKTGRYFDEWKDFRVYHRATDDSLNGCIVAEMNIKTESKFTLKGREEESVTLGGEPVIPGSVIKGFLRNKMKKIKGKRSDWIEKIFGSIKQSGGRSKIIVTDAIPKTKVNETKYIPKGTVLKTFILFDNIVEEDLQTILEQLQGIKMITGVTSARGGVLRGPIINNKVSFAIEKAWKFTIKDLENDITFELNQIL